MNPFDLDNPVIQFSTEHTAWTLRHAVEGTQIFGGIGSGKTSGSGRMLALKFLSQNFGGLVLTVKPDEKAVWEDYCKQTGRTDDLIIIEPGGKYHFNFLEYESTKSETNEAITENIVEVLKTVIRAGEEKDSGKSDDSFWESALDMLIFNVIDLCKMAYGSLSIEKMYAIVQSLPKPAVAPQPKSDDKKTSEKDNEPKEVKEFERAYRKAFAAIAPQIKAWKETCSPGELHRFQSSDAYNDAVVENINDARLLNFLHDFFFESFKSLNPKTRSIIEFIFSGFLFRLLREPVYSMFCRHPSNVVPEDCLKGKIILINLPVKKYHKVGRDCQILFKYIWQRAMEKRQIVSDSRLVFLWADEAQNFLHEHDADYQATARSSRIATVYITQNLPNYYAAMGGQKADYRVKSFLGTLGTKIFHSNADIETNRYASDLIGESLVLDPSRTITIAENFSQSDSISLKIEKLVRPEKFVSMKTGGPQNNYDVEGYFHKQGDQLFGKKSYKKMCFNQNYMP